MTGILVTTLVVLAAAPAAAAEPQVLALVIGTNRSVDTGVAPLRFADDDAARWAGLFGALGAQVALLARFDENTARLHPQALKAARTPSRHELTAAVTALAARAAAARRTGRRTTLYVLYAGHGNVDDDEGYVTLEDARLYGADLATDVLDRVGADEAHLVVDACHSFFLARSRGPGGRRRELRGFSQVPALADRPDIGLLLSTSAARESHEWDAFQAGVFSHEVRSGLHGAADADGDALVSYREIGAFVVRANAAIPNERFRPQVFARPPARGDRFVDLRPALAHQLVLPPALGGRLSLDDASGVRIADLHKAAGSAVRLVLPAVDGPLYLQRLADGREYEIPPGRGMIKLPSDSQPARTASRGALHRAFAEIFALPFDAGSVLGYRPEAAQDFALAAPVPPLPRWRRVAAIASLAAAGTGLAAGGALLWSARAAREAAGPTTSQRDAAAHNAEMRVRNTAALWTLGAAGAATVAGLLFLYVGVDGPSVTVASEGPLVGYRGRF